MKIHSLALFCLMGLAFAACGRDSTGSGGAGGSAGAGGSGGSGGTGGSGGGMVTTISALRMNPPGIGVAVTLNNVVVVQRVDSSKHGDVWVQDMGGGPYSGIHLFCNYDTANNPPKCPMTRMQIQGILRGQIVNVTGNYSPFTPSTPTGAPTVLEIGAPTITTTGMTGTPMSINVTAAQVAKDVTLANTLQYQGSYVKVTDGPFMISDVMPLTFQGACPAADASGMTWFGVEATGSGKTLEIGLTFHTSSTNTTSLTWCSGSCFMCPTAMELSGHTFSTVAGIAEPDSNSSTNSIYFKVMPTVDADLPM